MTKEFQGTDSENIFDGIDDQSEGILSTENPAKVVLALLRAEASHQNVVHRGEDERKRTACIINEALESLRSILWFKWHA